MIESQYMIVDFTICKDCVHFGKEMCEYPCDECLDNPINLDSKLPVYYKPKDEDQ